MIKPLEQKDLAQAVLPLIRARGELYRKAIANAHGREMHDAVALLEEALQTGDPKEVFIVTQKAITSAMYVIAKADDSYGIIGDACRRLLTLHPKVAAYAPALGELGMARYRKELVARETKLGPRPMMRSDGPAIIRTRGSFLAGTKNDSQYWTVILMQSLGRTWVIEG